ncbi:hypothetical protein BDN70DRAFT_898814 [Pholiota conissans]|uniref:Uncharacterized protein n=1 Tax=Pholiota conissans TaxID=109636 RepID=A0A9P5YSF6_9AGAR|nr:hypothetical protein BDN70DRAFT_898814 [Pholiota conissans]
MDIIVDPATMANSDEFIEALGRPAPNLKAFSMKTKSSSAHEITFPPSFLLFSFEAPSLLHLSIGRNAPCFTSSDSLLPIFATATLRHLALDAPMNLTTVEVLAALSLTPLLEEFSMNMSTLDPNITSIHPPDRFKGVSLPRLQSIKIVSQSLTVYSTFLDYITPHPVCILNMQIAHVLDGTETAPENVEEFKSDSTKLKVLDSQDFEIILYQLPGILEPISQSFIDAMLSLDFPQNITTFNSNLIPPTYAVPPLRKLSRPLSQQCRQRATLFPEGMRMK